MVMLSGVCRKCVMGGWAVNAFLLFSVIRTEQWTWKNYQCHRTGGLTAEEGRVCQLRCWQSGILRFLQPLLASAESWVPFWEARVTTLNESSMTLSVEQRGTNSEAPQALLCFLRYLDLGACAGSRRWLLQVLSVIVTGFSFQNTVEWLPTFEPFSRCSSVVTEESTSKKVILCSMCHYFADLW